MVIIGAFAAIDVAMTDSRSDVLHQFLSHRHLEFGIFAERNANGVAHALGEQRAYAHGTLYAAVLAVAGFGYAQVQREVHILGIHSHHQSAHGFHHHHGVRCLYRYHHIVEILSHHHTQKLHHALHHTRRSVAVAAHNAVAERAVVHSQTHCRAMLLAYGDKGDERLGYFLYLASIFFVGEREFFECSRHVNKVAGIDSHLVGHASGFEGSFGIEVNIGHQRHIVAFIYQLSAYHAYAVGLTHALSGESHQVGSGIGYAATLCHAALYVVSVGRRHRLHAHRVVRTHHQVLYLHCSGGSALVVYHLVLS